MNRLATALGAVLAASVAHAAERSAPSVLVEWIAFGLMLVGGLVFFGWVAWLAFKR